MRTTKRIIPFALLSGLLLSCGSEHRLARVRISQPGVREATTDTACKVPEQIAWTDDKGERHIVTRAEKDSVTGEEITSVELSEITVMAWGSYAMYRYSSGNLITVFRMTIPAQTLTTTSNYITLTGTPDMKLRGTSDMTTEPGRIHNYRIDYKIRITVLDYPQGGSTTGAGLYDMGSTCTVTASVNGGYEFAGWYEDGRIVSNDTRYSFEVLSDRTLEPRYRNYGGWSVTLTANPSVIGWQGGRSSLVAGASRGVFVNGVAENTQTAVPSLSGGAEGFLLSGNTVTVSENPSGSSRSCVFTASHGGSSATATITQEGSPVSYYFSYADGGTSHTEYPDDSSAGSFILDITSYKKTGNSTKALSWNASGDSWIHVNGSSVSYDENPAKERRTGLVTLKQDESGKTLSLKIVQPGKTSIDIEQ